MAPEAGHGGTEARSELDAARRDAAGCIQALADLCASDSSPQPDRLASVAATAYLAAGWILFLARNLKR